MWDFQEKWKVGKMVDTVEMERCLVFLLYWVESFFVVFVSSFFFVISFFSYIFLNNTQRLITLNSNTKNNVNTNNATKNCISLKTFTLDFHKKYQKSKTRKRNQVGKTKKQITTILTHFFGGFFACSFYLKNLFINHDSSTLWN